MNTAKTFFVAASSAVLASTLAIAGCASAPLDESASSGAALSGCTSDEYQAALAHYKDAVAWSKDRLAHGVCDTENGYLASIADAASQAVTTCGSFRETIKTSSWAAPLREALGPSLTLRSLTGELLVIKDSQFQNWAGTEALLARGVTFWANATGAYGPPYQIDFRANGDATWGFNHYDDQTGDITWRTVPARYTVTKDDGTEKGKRTLHVTHEGVTESFTLGVENPSAQTELAPVFTLSPVDGSQPTQKKLYSLVSECDA
jgi:hypothetical protein